MAPLKGGVRAQARDLRQRDEGLRRVQDAPVGLGGARAVSPEAQLRVEIPEEFAGRALDRGQPVEAAGAG